MPARGRRSGRGEHVLAGQGRPVCEGLFPPDDELLQLVLLGAGAGVGGWVANLYNGGAQQEHEVVEEGDGRQRLSVRPREQELVLVPDRRQRRDDGHSRVLQRQQVGDLSPTAAGQALRELRTSRADAVWVGWGFVAEDAAFVELCDRLGVTFVGPGVGELIHSATVAVAGQVPIGRLWHAVPSYPTLSEVWLRLLEAYRG